MRPFRFAIALTGITAGLVAGVALGAANVVAKAWRLSASPED